MGRTRRPQPEGLKHKLTTIRKAFDWTMDQMAAELKSAGAEESLHSGYIADYESGRREPSLLVLLRYARLVEISTDVLIDDQLDLPDRLRNKVTVKSAIPGRKPTSKANRK
jgi:transcriptional regulator with XRE-family HTH domain